MTQEQLSDYMKLYETMDPKNFIEMVYAMGSYQGRLKEIRQWTKAIKTVSVVGEMYSIYDKVRDEAVND